MGEGGGDEVHWVLGWGVGRGRGGGGWWGWGRIHGFFWGGGFFYLILLISLGMWMINRDVGFFEGVK